VYDQGARTAISKRMILRIDSATTQQDLASCTADGRQRAAAFATLNQDSRAARIKLCLGSAALFGFIYVASLPWHPYPMSYLVKAMPALILAGLALSVLIGRDRILMPLAYVAAAAGDVFLDLDGTAYLAQGLSCFLVMQVLFCWVFGSRARWTPARAPLIAGLAAIGIAIIVVAWQDLGAMRLPVTIYVAALLSMVATATMVRGSPWVGLGAVFFMISDALIGINHFIVAFDYAVQIFVALYMAAQLLIAWGIFAGTIEDSGAGKA